MRSQKFMAGKFPFKYCQFVSSACREVVSGYFPTTGLQVFPDKMVTVWDKMGSDNDKTWADKTSQFPDGHSHGRD